MIDLDTYRSSTQIHNSKDQLQILIRIWDKFYHLRIFYKNLRLILSLIDLLQESTINLIIYKSSIRIYI